MRRRLNLILVLALILIFGIAPAAAYWFAIGRAPEVTPQEARQILADPSANAILVDVRPAKEFAAAHLAGAVNWPLAEIQNLAPGAPLQAGLANRKLLLICTGGWMSNRAAIALRAISVNDSFSIRGGMQNWSATAAPACPVGMVLAPAGASPSAVSTPAVLTRISPPHEQWAAVLTGFAVKPAYMLLSLILAIVLWKRKEADLASLRWGLLAFFIGEAFCAANYLFVTDTSYLFEYLHSFGMVLAFAFTGYAVLEAIDLRLIRYSHPTERCAAVTLCHACIKHAKVACGLRRVFLFMIPATMAVAAMPLCANFRKEAYVTRIFSAEYAYIHPIVHQICEIRVLPLVALALMAASLIVLLLKERHPVPISKILFAAGLGAMSFSLFRFALFTPFADNQVWFGFWEEITELIYIVGAGVILIIFRRGLFPAVQRVVPASAEAPCKTANPT